MPSADKSKVLRRQAKRYELPLRACTVASACDRFLKARGMTAQRENFNKGSPTEEPKTEP